MRRAPGYNAAPGAPRRHEDPLSANPAATDGSRTSRRLQHLYEVGRALARAERVAQAIPEALAIAGRAVTLHDGVAVFEAGAEVEATAWRLGSDDPRRTRAQVAARATYDYLVGRAPAAAIPSTEDGDGTRAQRIALPFVVEHRVVGALLLHGSGMAEDDLVFLNAIAQQIALALGRGPRAAGPRGWALEQRDHSPAGQLVVSADGEILDMSATAARLLVVDPQGLHLPLHAFVANEDVSALVAHLRSTLASDGRRCLHVEVTPRGHRDRTVLLTSRLLRRRDGPVCLTALLDVTARRREDGAQRLLGQAGEALSSLDPRLVIAALCRLAVPALADLAVVDLVLDDGRLLRRAEVHHVDPERGRRFARAEERWGLPPNVAFTTLEALRTGRVGLIPEVGPRYMELASVDSDHFASMIGLALRSWLVVPLGDPSGRGPLAALRLATAGTRRPFDADDAELSARVGRLAAQALANAREHERLRPRGPRG